MSDDNACPRTGLPHSYWPQGNCQYCGEVSPVLASTREERDRLREALALIEGAGERIRTTLINHLDEPVRRAFWDGVAIRDAARAALSQPTAEGRES